MSVELRNHVIVEVLVDADGPEKVPMVEQRVADAVKALEVTQLTRQPIDVLPIQKRNRSIHVSRRP